ncbi:VOC family protein [Paenibacillus alba]|uniref:Glyoxalase n=1 Tax=Paenibacillus alba TaxID=1197127 RepID=A0ABU6GDM3_9BACL|nr:VOC family protein [Paenibacillus alba]MEC0232006.1 glyoxalase [Paenibacillus alba]
MTYSFIGLDHVQLAAPEGCEEQARSFFVDLLGWQEIPKPELLQARGGIWAQCGAHQVHIGVQKDFAAATKAHPAFRVQHLDKLREYLIQSDISVIDDEARYDEGVRRFFMHDPFGNRLEFLEQLDK